MKDKIKINLETGCMIDIVHPSLFGEDIIETPCLIPYRLPKWNGTEWVEGATEFPKVEEVIEVSLEDRVVSIEETLDVLFEGNI